MGLALLLSILSPTPTSGFSPVSHERDSVLALVGGEIHTGTGSRIPEGTILIRNGVIERLGPQVPVPFDAEEIDCRGLVLYPGFIDAATHLGQPEEKKLMEILPSRDDRAAVVTETVLSSTRSSNRKGLRPQIAACDWIDLSQKSGQKHREAGFTTVLSAPQGQILCGQSALINLSGAEPREALVRSKVAHHGAFRVRGEGYPTTTMGIMAHLRQLFYDAQHYRELWKCYRQSDRSMRRPPLDQTLESIVPLLEGAPLIFEANRENSILRVLSLAEEFDLRLVVDGGTEAFRILDELKARDASVLVEVNFPEKPETRADKAAKKAKEKEEKEKKNKEKAKPEDEEEGASSSETAEEKKPDAASDKKVLPTENDKPKKGARGSKRDPDKKKEPKAKESDDEDLAPERVLEDQKRDWDERAGNAARLYEAGIPFAFTTRNLGQPKDLFKSVKAVIEAGLPEDAALEALTLTPARILGVERELGSLEPGKIANVLVSRGNLGDEKMQIKMVFVDGVRFDVEAPKKKTPGGGSSGKPAKGLDLTGTWDVVTEGQMGSFESKLVLTQEDDVLTGTLKSQMGEAEVSSGQIEARNVTLVITFEMGGESMDLEIDAVVDEDGNSMTGKLKTPFGPGSEANMKATRANPSASDLLQRLLNRRRQTSNSLEEESVFSCCEGEGHREEEERQ